jgi:hypothetical protein
MSFVSLCHEPSAGVVDNLEFKIKKEGSYNYEYKKGSSISRTKPNRDDAGQSSSFVTL